MCVDGVATLALIDTGAAVSVIDAKLCRMLRKVTTPVGGVTLRTASAQPLEPLAACTARVTIQGVVYVVELIVLSACSHSVILGWDFLSRHHAIIDCDRAEVELFPEVEKPQDETTAKLRVNDDTHIPPGSSALVPLSCNSISDATVVFEPSGLICARKGLSLPFAVLDIATGAGTMLISNPTSFPTTLFRGECLGVVEEVNPGLLVSVFEELTPVDITALGLQSPPDDTLLRSAIDDDLPSAERDELLTLIHRFTSSFDCCDTALGRTSTVCHEIDTGTHAPLRQRPYRVSSTERRVIDEQVADMLKRNVIRPSVSPWASPVVLVKKRTALFNSVWIIAA